MTKRKLVLIIADALLLAVCIIQCALRVTDSAKIFEMKDTPDMISIAGEKGSFDILREGEGWVIGDKKYAANDSSIDSIIEAVSSIRALDKVGNASSESAKYRYDLTDAKKITVTAYKDGKVLRSLEIGKDATATSQGYITIDGGKDIYLASGSLRLSCNKSIDELRSKVIWQLEKNGINSVSISSADESKIWTVSRLGEGTDITWNISGSEVDVDPEKAVEWFNSFASISTPVWHNEGDDLGGNKLLSAKIGYGFKDITITIFEIPAETEDGKATYWGTCSETPYTFELAGYAVQKFQKEPEALGK